MPPATSGQTDTMRPSARQRASTDDRRHPAAVVAHGLPSRQELTRTYCMKGTGTAAGIGATPRARRKPWMIDQGRSTHRATDARQRPPPAGMPPPYSSPFPPAPPPIRSPYPPNAPRPRPAAPDRAAAAPRTGPARARRARPVRCRARRPRGAPAWRRRRTRRAHSPGTRPPCLAHHHALEFALVHVIGQYVLRFHIGSLPRPPP